MKEKIKEIIIEERQEMLTNLVPRELSLDNLPGKATILTGIRRSGKSTHLRSFIRKKKKPYFYINFSDERLSYLKGEELGLCIEAFFEMEPDAENKNICIGLDEIQIIEGWELFVDRILRNRLYEVYITGSSAKLLSKEIGTQMRGRSLQYEFFPYSFNEYIFPVKNPSRKLTGPEKGKFIHLTKKYLSEGGFPEVRGLTEGLRNKILQEYYNTIIYKDIIERYRPKNTQAVALCLKILINQVASLYSVSKIVNKCKSMGVNIAKGDVSEFIEWFQDCYLLYSVPIFSENINRQMTNPRKLYCIDNGFIRANQAGVSSNTGHLLENLVFNILRKSSEKIFYYKGYGEVDFVSIKQGMKPHLIQVCEDLNSPETRHRELNSLYKAMVELDLKSAWLINHNEHKIETMQGKKIFILPLLEVLRNPLLISHEND
jgi:predicted AAA+ superfamily ATPase